MCTDIHYFLFFLLFCFSYVLQASLIQPSQCSCTPTHMRTQIQTEAEKRIRRTKGKRRFNKRGSDSVSEIHQRGFRTSRVHFRQEGEEGREGGRGGKTYN
jgi:hypothetical protein